MAASAEAFVPFEPAVGRKQESGVRSQESGPCPVSPVSRVAGFEPFQAPGPARAQVHVHSPGAGQPVVTLQREGERVTGIRVECACGQVIELACSY